MTYINVGAYFSEGTDKTRVATKKALRDHLKNDPGDVEFDNTARPLGPGEEVYRASEIPAGIKFQVCGPDPYTSRKWYATVQMVDGKPKVTA